MRIPTRYLLVLIAFGSAVVADANAGQALYAIEDDDRGVNQVNPLTGIEGQQCFIGGGGADATTGMAAHPTTGDFYISVEITGSTTPKLTRLDLRTCVTTDIGNLGELITGLAFDSAGTLYAVTSDNAGAASDTLYTVDLNTAALTFFMDLPGPDGFGDTIAFNPDDGLLYHLTGEQGNGLVAFNAIDLTNMTSNAIALSGSRPGGTVIRSFTWDADNGYFVGYRAGTAQVAPVYFSLTTTGGQTDLSVAAGRQMAGMAFYDTDVLPDPAPVSTGGTLYSADGFGPFIAQLDPVTGNELALQGIEVPGMTIFGFNGLTLDPTTNELYAIARMTPCCGSRAIVKLDPATGVGEFIGETGERVAALAVDAAGVMYAASSENSLGDPETLYTVDKGDGSMTFFTTMGGGGASEALAFNSTDGDLYRASGTTNLQAYDLDTAMATNIPLSGVLTGSDRITALVYDASQNQFFGWKRASGPNRFFSISLAGVTANVGGVNINKTGLAFSPGPAAAVSDITTFPDITGDSVPDVAGFIGGDESQPNIVVYSGASGDVHSTIAYINDNWRAVALGTIRDADQDATADDPAVAMLVVNKTTQKIRVETRRLDTGAFLGSIQFFNDNWRAVDVVVVDDLDGNGNTSDSALAVLAERFTDGRVQVQLRDFGSGALISNVVYVNARWLPIAAAVADRRAMAPMGTLLPVIGVLAEKPLDGRRLMQSRVAGSGVFDQNIKFLGSAWDYNDVSVNHDANGNGSNEDPVWEVLATRTSDNVIRVQSRFVSDGSFDSNAAILNENWQAFRLDSGLDMGGGSAGELVISAIRRADEVRRIHVKDRGTGTTTINIAP